MRDASIAALVGIALLLAGLACGPGPTTPATLAEVQETIFSPRCSLASCHGGANPVRDLDLQAGATHASTVGVESTIPGRVYIVPGDPAASFLLTVVTEGAVDDGIDQMPPGFALPAEELALLESWIENGAEDD